MNFFSRRYLLSICVCFILPLFVMSVIDEEIRPVATLIAITAVLFVAAVKLFKRLNIPNIKSGLTLFESICFIVVIISCTLPLFLYNLTFSKYEELSGKEARVEAVVRDVFEQTEYYSAFFGEVRAVNGEAADFGINVFAALPTGIKENDIIIFDAVLTDINDGDYEYSKTYLKRNNILYSAELDGSGLFAVMGKNEDILTKLSAANRHAGYMLDFRFSPTSASLAKALLLGDRSYLPDILNRDFGRIGITHLLALSGMHLALFTGAYLFFAKRLIRNRSLLYLSVIILTIFILLFTGLSASLLRAALMLTVSYIGLILHKKPDSLTVLFFVAALILVFDPYAALDVGLILSFTSTFGILLLMPYLQSVKLGFFKKRGLGIIPRTLISFVYDSVAVSFSACSFTNLVLFFFFDGVSLIGIFSTLMFSPLIVLYIILSFLIFLFYKMPFVCDILSDAVNFLYNIIELPASKLSGLDFVVASSKSFVFGVSFAVMALVFIIMVKRNSHKKHYFTAALAVQLSFLLLLGSLVLIRSQNSGLTAVGDGQNSGYILSSGNVSSVIDVSDGTSYASVNVIKGVYSVFDADIDTLMLTHYHYRHSNMLRKINASMPIRKLLLPTPSAPNDEKYAQTLVRFAQVHGIEAEFYNSAGDTLTLSESRVTILPMTRATPSSHVKLALNITCSNVDYFITDSHSYRALLPESYLSFARRADVAYVCAHSGEKLTDMTVFGKNTLVYTPK